MVYCFVMLICSFHAGAKWVVPRLVSVESSSFACAHTMPTLTKPHMGIGALRAFLDRAFVLLITPRCNMQVPPPPPDCAIAC